MEEGLGEIGCFRGETGICEDFFPSAKSFRGFCLSRNGKSPENYFLFLSFGSRREGAAQRGTNWKEVKESEVSFDAFSMGKKKWIFSLKFIFFLVRLKVYIQLFAVLIFVSDRRLGSKIISLRVLHPQPRFEGLHLHPRYFSPWGPVQFSRK